MLAAPSLAEILDCWIGGIMNTITPRRRHTTGTGIGYASIGPKCLRLICKDWRRGGIRFTPFLAIVVNLTVNDNTQCLCGFQAHSERNVRCTRRPLATSIARENNIMISVANADLRAFSAPSTPPPQAPTRSPAAGALPRSPPAPDLSLGLAEREGFEPSVQVLARTTV